MPAHPERDQPRTAVIYARVNSDDQAKGYSLPTQVDTCEQYANMHHLGVLASFLDDYTGESLDRPALDQLRAFVKTNVVHSIIVLDVDRWARKSVYQMLLEDEFARVGVKVDYVNGQYADSDEGRLQKQIRGAIAEYEKAKITERSKRGKRGKAKSGYVNVAARSMYGYRVVSEPHKSWLEIDEEEAEIVRLVFQLYVNGQKPGTRMSLNGISTYLTNLKVPTRGDKQKHVAKKQGFGVWSYGMVRHIVTNLTYIGEWHYGKTHMVDDGNQAKRKTKSKRSLGKQVARPREDWIRVEVPAIIDRDLLEAAQVRLEENKRKLGRRPVKKPHMLAKRLRCGHCGYVARAKSFRHWRYYECNGKHRNPPVCEMKAHRAALVDEVVWDWVKDFIQHPDRAMAGFRARQAELNENNERLRDRQKLIQDRLQAIESQLEKLLDLYLSGGFPKDVLTARKHELEKLRSDLHREHGALATQLESEDLTDQQVEHIEAFCAELRIGLENATFEDKQRYLELLDMQGILIDENNERVVYVTCHLGKQRLVLAATLPSSNIGAIATTRCACPPAAHSR